MSVLQFALVITTISVYLQQVSAEKWIKSNTQGSFAMGFMDGYINNGDYEIVVPKGSDETKRDILIKSDQVRDSVYMIFNPNTMVFSNWDGYFKLGNEVYSDSPGVLYYMRSDHKCDRKRYDKQQGEKIITIDQELLDETECQAIKAKVDAKMNHFLKYPFKYMLPKPDLELKSLKGFPGGEYYTGKVSGNVYVCQYSVEIPPGDTDKDKEVVISGPGVKDRITMKINANTQMYGKWDGTFYIGDKVYSNEPRVIYVDDDKGNCVKKVFKDHDTSITIAYTKILQANDCFLIKNEVYNAMQKLIADPKLLAADEKPKPPPPNPSPISVTSTVVYPKDETNSSTMSGVPSQSTHTITFGPGSPSSSNPDKSAASGVATANINGNVQLNVGESYQVPTTSSGLQQPLNPLSGVNSHVHISTVTSDHPDYPSVSATTVMQNQMPQQIPPVIQPQTFVVNQGQTAKITPQLITLSQPSPVTNQVKLVVPPATSSPASTYILQPGNTPAITLQPTQNEQTNALNVHSNNVNIQADGSFLVDGKSLILQGLDPNADLITPDGNVIRVGRSINQPESSTSYQTVSFVNQPNSLPVLTLSGNSQTQSGNFQTVLTVPPNQESQIQHTMNLKVPNNDISGLNTQQNQLGNPSTLAVNTKFAVKSGTQQPETKLYFLQSNPTASNENSQTKPSTNRPVVLKLVQPGSYSPTILKFQTNDIAHSTQITENPGGQSQIQNRNSDQSSIILTTSSQSSTNSAGDVKPVLLTVRNPAREEGAQGGSNVHLNLGGSANSVLISTQGNKQQDSTSNQPLGENNKDEKGKSVFNLMRDLNLPSPVNNLIVNIAENTNFHKKKK